MPACAFSSAPREPPSRSKYEAPFFCKERLALLKEHVKAKHYHATFEPMSDDVGLLDLDGYEWVVVGTGTGNCKGKIPSQKSWVESIAQQTALHGIPVFMKEALLGIIPEEQMIQNFPAGMLPN